MTQSARRRRIQEDDAADARLVPLAPRSARGGRRQLIVIVALGSLTRASEIAALGVGRALLFSIWRSA